MRAFIAFDFNNETNKNLANIQKHYFESSNKKLRLTKLEQIHLTYFFLGEITTEQVEGIKKIIFNSDISFPIELEAKSLIYLPSKNKPNVIAIETASTDILNFFIKDNDLKLDKIGFKRDKKWLPHITIGRANNGFIPINLQIEKFNVVIKNITLYKSTLTKAGPIYQEIFRKGDL